MRLRGRGARGRGGREAAGPRLLWAGALAGFLGGSAAWAEPAPPTSEDEIAPGINPLPSAPRPDALELEDPRDRPLPLPPPDEEGGRPPGGRPGERSFPPEVEPREPRGDEGTLGPATPDEGTRPEGAGPERPPEGAIPDGELPGAPPRGDLGGTPPTPPRADDARPPGDDLRGDSRGLGPSTDVQQDRRSDPLERLSPRSPGAGLPLPDTNP